MAGVKGRSGGSRMNTGGARAGSGRKMKAPQLIEFSSNGDPKAFLVAVMDDQSIDIRLRIAALRPCSSQSHHQDQRPPFHLFRILISLAAHALP